MGKERNQAKRKEKGEKKVQRSRTLGQIIDGVWDQIKCLNKRHISSRMANTIRDSIHDDVLSVLECKDSKKFIGIYKIVEKKVIAIYNSYQKGNTKDDKLQTLEGLYDLLNQKLKSQKPPSNKDTLEKLRKDLLIFLKSYWVKDQLLDQVIKILDEGMNQIGESQKTSEVLSKEFKDLEKKVIEVYKLAENPQRQQDSQVFEYLELQEFRDSLQRNIDSRTNENEGIFKESHEKLNKCISRLSCYLSIYKRIEKLLKYREDIECMKKQMENCQKSGEDYQKVLFEQKKGGRKQSKRLLPNGSPLLQASKSFFARTFLGLQQQNEQQFKENLRVSLGIYLLTSWVPPALAVKTPEEVVVRVLCVLSSVNPEKILEKGGEKSGYTKGEDFSNVPVELGSNFLKMLKNEKKEITDALIRSKLFESTKMKFKSEWIEAFIRYCKHECREYKRLSSSFKEDSWQNQRENSTEDLSVLYQVSIEKVIGIILQDSCINSVLEQIIVSIKGNNKEGGNYKRN